MSELTIATGQILFDKDGHVWVCLGYRNTTVDTRAYHFTQAYPSNAPWFWRPRTYSASHPNTLFKMFPPLREILIKQRLWDAKEEKPL